MWMKNSPNSTYKNDAIVGDEHICTPRFLETTKSPPPEIKKDKPKPWHAVQLPEGWEEHMFILCDRRRSLIPSVSAPSQNSTTPILQEDQVKGTPMEEDAGDGKTEAEEVEVNVLADEGSQCPDDGASQLPDDEACLVDATQCPDAQLSKSKHIFQAHRALMQHGMGQADVARGHAKQAHSIQHKSSTVTRADQHMEEVHIHMHPSALEVEHG
ncbi:hypothetical protein F5J12DRAFT_787331 [Pisolithus orientalis]|uniref:uncharacterized protein n=1 Tax=Pisolithus orientalis TaxID=936130 RepID=UPI00222513E1|nr:uncharacterized protein F5J12DRAFT_787331 [Pisolithus orientalis]KAI5985811.1 hypothetical protein F5J12DRAFT_787331 [Pisolithus orientalis]